MSMGSSALSAPLPTKQELLSLREWLATWGDGANWSDKTGVTVPMEKNTLLRLLAAADHLLTYPGIMDDAALYEWEQRLQTKPEFAGEGTS